MQLEKIQLIIARLYTEETFRKSLFCNITKFCAKNDIHDQTTFTFLSSLSEKQFDFFSRGLMNKRMHEVRNLVPLTTRILGKQFRELFFEFGKDFPSAGIHVHHNDAVNFLKYILIRFEKEKNETNDILLEVANFENLKITNFLQPGKIFISAHNFDLRKLYTDNNPGDSISIDTNIKTIIFWKNGKIRRRFFFKSGFWKRVPGKITRVHLKYNGQVI